MSRKLFLCFILVFFACFACFGQTAALRDYVGMISQGFHPDIITFLQKLKSDHEKRGDTARARSVDNLIKGESGTGFIYVASDGKNYILTNYHVISMAHTLTITFETQSGEKTKYSDLTILAADEDMDIALLAFAGGQNPFKQGLSLLTRPVEEGEDVYSAGFPGTIGSLIWQLGRGIISNASVRLPPEDENDKAIGPYIQHTAQIDPGNSGGPLLVQARNVTTGYAVAGINTLSIRRRQAANYSIPVNRIQSFLDASLKPQTVDQRPRLEERVNAFVKGLSVPRAVYPHIAQFLSNICVGENAEYAVTELFKSAPRSVIENVLDRDTIASMAYSVAWIIENSLRSKSGGISIKLNSINTGENGTYNVSFDVNGGSVDSVWVNEYGYWRILKFGTIASGDKTLGEKKKKEKAESERLRIEPDFMISAGVALNFDPGFGVEIIVKTNKSTGFSIKGFFFDGLTQVEAGYNFFIPISVGSVAVTPFLGAGPGIRLYSSKNKSSSSDITLPGFGVWARAGVLFTTSWVPGLFVQASYQYSLYFDVSSKPSVLYIGAGYSW